LRNIIFNINDIWDKNNKTSVENQTIFNRLDDERNRISDCTENKKIKTRNFCKEIKIR
jgi:ribonucleotide reductase alpha subunit